MVIKSHPVVTSCMLIVENHNQGGHIEIVHQLLREKQVLYCSHQPEGTAMGGLYNNPGGSKTVE